MSKIATALFCIVMSNAQDLKLRGDRFQPLTYSELTPEQKTMADHVLSGERKSMDGPFNAYLRSPQMGDIAQQFGAYLRFHSSVPRKLNEMAIIITARYWNAQFEWYAHHRYALEAGLSPAIADAIAAGKRPASMQADEQAVYDFCTELLNSKQVSDKTYGAAKKTLGERGVVDLIAVLGYYHFVSMVLNVDR
ncbi:MAG: carboxymuconolactone decarboxylase, partial [Acidobacteriia bacterium]|nr:carboxymuconolactone decarboxylase [Terriglobia bacterium]